MKREGLQKSKFQISVPLIASLAAVFFNSSELFAHGYERSGWITFSAVFHFLVSLVLAITITVILRGKERRMTRVFLPAMLILLILVPVKMALYTRFDWRLPGFGSDPSIIVYYIIITLFVALLACAVVARRKK
jgi:hypothetical protein